MEELRIAIRFLLLALALVSVIPLSGCDAVANQPGSTPASELTPPVPEEYQAVYDELEAEMAHFEVTLNETWDHSLAQTTIATELAYANGNIGEGLLSANIMNYNRMLLDPSNGCQRCSVGHQIPLAQTRLSTFFRIPTILQEYNG
jgi:hypothetical protein